MIYEYALEPALVATWGNRDKYRFVKNEFGIGTSRIISDYPHTNWIKMVYDACNTTDDIERTMLDELIMRLTDRMIFRSDGIYDKNKPWIESAELENRRLPFRAIISKNNPSKNKAVIIEDDLGVSDNHLWDSDIFPTQRSAQAMAKSISGMLSNCTTIVFVDPYFTPHSSDKVKPLQSFLLTMSQNRKSQLTHINFVARFDDNVDSDSFQKGCTTALAEYLPSGQVLTILRIKQRFRREQFHNRYVLTDIGGVNFGIGLDEGYDGQTDDIGLLPRHVYDLRWKQYSTILSQKDSEQRTFNLLEEPIRIEGTGSNLSK